MEFCFKEIKYGRDRYTVLNDFNCNATDTIGLSVKVNFAQKIKMKILGMIDSEKLIIQ